jgi:outer membrane receptor protein involved in Fe transport
MPTLAIYANSGSSFVAPSAKSVGGTLNASDTGVAGKNGQLPNPGLKPENGIGSDLGIDLQPLDTMKIGIRGFYNYLDDAIVENAVSQIPSQSKSVNAGKAHSYGVEVTVEQAVADYLQWFANLTFTASEVKNSLDKDQDGSELSFVPNFVTNVGATAKLPLGFIVTPYVHMVGTYYDSTSRSGRRTFGPYQVVNLKLEKSILKSADCTMTAAVDLNNLFNSKYEMPWQFQDPGFNAFGSLELKF